MDLKIIKKPLNNGQYLVSEEVKKSLFLHHTESTNAMSAWRWWNSTPQRIGTAYIIERDGSIIECFPPSMWAYHLGVKGDLNWSDKHSIGIELVSTGGLRLEGSQFRFYPLWPNKLRYTVIPKNEVFELKKEWRGFKYFHKYTENQIEALKELIKLLWEKFPTLVIDNDLTEVCEYDEAVWKEKIPGIWSHSTVRSNKSDIFPYPDLLNALFQVQGELLKVVKSVIIPEVTIKPKSVTRKKA